MGFKEYYLQSSEKSTIDESAASDATRALKDRDGLRKALDDLVGKVENFTFSGSLDPDRDSFNEKGAVKKAQKILDNMGTMVIKMQSLTRQWPD
jgi:hypothetical protein